MQHTTNYNLNQWEDADRVTRADVNADNTKIDAALKSVSDASPEIVFGTYTGDNEETRTISLGRAAKILFVMPMGCEVVSSSRSRMALAAQGHPAQNEGGNQVLTLTDSGFVARNLSSHPDCHLNDQYYTYYYVAIF